MHFVAPEPRVHSHSRPCPLSCPRVIEWLVGRGEHRDYLFHEEVTGDEKANNTQREIQRVKGAESWKGAMERYGVMKEAKHDEWAISKVQEQDGLRLENVRGYDYPPQLAMGWIGVQMEAGCQMKYWFLPLEFQQEKGRLQSQRWQGVVLKM